jgi:hypothetical protein
MEKLMVKELKEKFENEHRKLDRSQTWCVGTKTNLHQNSPAYSRVELRAQNVYDELEEK